MATDTTQASQPGVLDTVSNWISEANSLFNTGLGFYTAADQRIEALNSIKEDSSPTKTVTSQPAVSSGKDSTPAWLMPVLIGVGILAVIIIFRKR